MSTVDQRVVEQTAPTDEFLKVETHGIEPIPSTERKGSPRDVAWLWVAAFANFVSLITGGLLITFGLGVGEAIVAVAAGSVPAGLPPWFLGGCGAPHWAPPGVGGRPPLGVCGAHCGAGFSPVL